MVLFRFLFVGLILLFLSATVSGQKQSIDMSAIPMLWPILEKMEKDMPPSEDEWKALFETRGYKAMGEWNCNMIKNNLLLVFMPSNRSALEKRLQNGNYWIKRDLNHLLQVKGRQKELKEYSQKVDVNQQLEKALAKAEAYLPKGITKKIPPPPIQFIVFGPDARAMGGNIIFDLLYTMNAGEEPFIKILGHEVHHHYSNQIPSKVKIPDQIEPSYTSILDVLNTLKTEGIADLINRPFPTILENNDTGRYMIEKKAHAEHQSKMKTLDSILSKLNSDTTGMYQLGKYAFNLFPMNCHPNGHYMAVLVAKHFPKSKLIEASNNLFLFFRFYKSACDKESNEYRFSKETMHFVEGLEKRFTIPSKRRADN